MILSNINNIRSAAMKSGTIVLFTIALFLGGCSRNAKVSALQPAEVDRAAHTKRIAITPFKDDTVGVAGKIESALSATKIDGKRYFTVISRGDIDHIMREQKLQHSGLLDEDKSVELGALLGAQALISGHISAASSSDTHYRASRTKCRDNKCKESYEYTVPCIKRKFILAAQIKMVDIQKGDIIFGDTLQNSTTHRHCSDDERTLPSRADALEQLSGTISQHFVYKLTPHYITYEVTLLEDPDIDYTSEEEKLLENALIYIEHQRYDKAEKLLSRLLEESNDRSYVAAYDLGVVKEITGRLDEAQQLYSLADELTIEPIEAIDTAMLRIRRSIADHDRAQRQIRQ